MIAISVLSANKTMGHSLPHFLSDCDRLSVSESSQVLRSGDTGDKVWDAMQRYLVQTGELHNNARMGWGKSILKWTDSPEQALQVLTDLNNRYQTV